MRVALTGASGFIGSAIARHLHTSGHSVAALVRETSTRAHVEPFIDRFVVGDHDDHSVWSDLLDGADAVVHNSLDVRSFRDNDMATHLRSNLVGSIEFLRASAPARFVFISTMAVYNDIRPAGVAIVTEDHPMRPKTMYGAYKAAVEAHLWSEHIDNNRHAVAIRPCAVYGTDTTGKNIHTRPTLEAIRSGEPYTREGGNFYVHLDDVARATVAAVERDDASGNAYNLVDCYVRFADLARMTADALGIDAVIDVSSPEVPEHEFDTTLAKSLVEDNAFLSRGHDGIRAHLRELVAEHVG